jgi:diacylglycerol kinase family enzyme
VPASPPLESLERLGASFAALDAPVERKRMLVIVNPYATSVSDQLRSLVVYALQGRYQVEAIDTLRRGHATELCREAAAEGLDVVLVFGGDGTVNEAANGLIGSNTPLTCLPGGATNVFAKMLGIPGDIVDATEHLLRVADDWRPRLVDLASVGHRSPPGEWSSRHFTFSAGVGLDAAVVRRCDAHPERKARYKQWYFAAAAVTTFCREYLVHPPRLETHAGGRVIRGVTSVVQNGDPFTYFANDKPVHVAEGISLQDGSIAGVVLNRATPLDIPTVAARLLSHRLRVVRHRRVDGWSGVTEARIVSVDGRPVPLQIDGDWIGDVTEAAFGVTPSALSVVA